MLDMLWYDKQKPLSVDNKLLEVSQSPAGTAAVDTN